MFANMVDIIKKDFIEVLIFNSFITYEAWYLYIYLLDLYISSFVKSRIPLKAEPGFKSYLGVVYFENVIQEARLRD